MQADTPEDAANLVVIQTLDRQSLHQQKAASVIDLLRPLTNVRRQGRQRKILTPDIAPHKSAVRARRRCSVEFGNMAGRELYDPTSIVSVIAAFPCGCVADELRCLHR